ncbi:MAG: hypothetical protein KF703_17420 [Actinobacteria bacterium]|nr:hypothetical protein [Actinomycetota bacterium]
MFTKKVLLIAVSTVLLVSCGSSDSEGGSSTAEATTSETAAASTTVATTAAPTTAAPTTTAAATTEAPSTPSGGTVSLSAADYSKSFTVQSCTNPTESTLSLTATASGGLTLTIAATDGSGTLAVTGGDEQDGINLSGTVTSVGVGDDGSIQVSGSMSSGSEPSEPFTLTGSC